MPDIGVTREAIRHILETHPGPQIAARLKQLLNAEWARRGERPFRQQEFGFKKFSDFLEAQSDLVKLEKPDGPGDLQVSLVPRTADPAVEGGRSASREGSERRSRVRAEIWNALVSADSSRARYVHRTTGQLVDEQSDDPAVRESLRTSPDEYALIEPVSGEDQLAWMRAYVQHLPIPPEQKAFIAKLATGPYTSKGNAAFTAALEEHGLGWTRFRTNRRWDHLRKWARKHRVELRTLKETVPSRSAQSVGTEVQALATGRDRVWQLLGMISDRDVDELVLPHVLTIIWLNARRPT